MIHIICIILNYIIINQYMIHFIYIKLYDTFYIKIFASMAGNTIMSIYRAYDLVAIRFYFNKKYSSFDFQKRLANPLGWTHTPPGGPCTPVREPLN